MSATFLVRTIHLDPRRVESGSFDLEPTLPQGQVVCNLFGEFLAERPAEFREKLPFLKKVDVELEWAAAGGGAAFATLYRDAEPLAMGILMSGAQPETDGQMLDAMRGSILRPMLGEDIDAMDGEPRPAVLLLQMPGQPERFAMVQLLITALASVYFRAVQRMAGANPD